MQTVILDPVTLVKLSSVDNAVTLTDAAGHVVGRFIPAADSAVRQAMEPQISEEELLRREQLGGGRSLLEIFRDF